MIVQKNLDIQRGIWIEAEWLEEAGLGAHFQVVVADGEIRIVTETRSVGSAPSSENGWETFFSLEDGMTPGVLCDASLHHDRYLYGKTR